MDFYSTFPVFWSLKAAYKTCQIQPFTHTQQFGVQYLALGHFDRQLGGIQTSDLLINRLPPVLQPAIQMTLTTVGQKSQILLGSLRTHCTESLTTNISENKSMVAVMGWDSMQRAPYSGGGGREECVLTSLHLAGRTTSGCDWPCVQLGQTRLRWSMAEHGGQQQWQQHFLTKCQFAVLPAVKHCVFSVTCFRW